MITYPEDALRTGSVGLDRVVRLVEEGGLPGVAATVSEGRYAPATAIGTSPPFAGRSRPPGAST